MEMRKEETVTADSFDVELSDEAFEENWLRKSKQRALLQEMNL